MFKKRFNGVKGDNMEIKVKVLVHRYTTEGEIVRGKEVFMDSDLAEQLERQGFVEILDKKERHKKNKKED
jgi:hypothetical protein